MTAREKLRAARNEWQYLGRAVTLEALFDACETTIVEIEELDERGADHHERLKALEAKREVDAPDTKHTEARREFIEAYDSWQRSRTSGDWRSTWDAMIAARKRIPD